MAKRILSLLLGLMVLCTMVLSAGAYEVPNPETTGSIAVAMTHKGEPVSGGTLTLYRVADVKNSGTDYYFSYTKEFQSCALPLTNLFSAELAAALAKIAAEDNLTGTTRALGTKGRTRFDNLEIGLYLLVQYTAAPGYNRISPFLVSVPGQENGSYIYDVNASPKVELEPLPTTKPTETTKPTGDKLPQTGQVNWPMPILASAGLFLIGVGLCLKASDRRKRYEE